ncbi:MAG TPA: polysaccharide export protein EpsE [Steroidobacteraceae bacterium]|nr:polysaccharide export protein EpsE [Steroidobacteraceae bacterium]
MRQAAALRRLAVRLAFVIAVATSAAPCLSDVHESLGAGDTIRVTVFQNPDLTTEARLSDQGTIMLPLVGEIVLANTTTTTASARIAERLTHGKFLVNPQVSVSILEVRSRQVSVLGQVVRPGRYALDGTSSRLTDLLALAGGIDPTGDDTVVVMATRDGQAVRRTIDVPKMYRTGDLSQNLELQPGDAIFVPRAPVFYIQGEVQRPGAYRLEPEASVLSAISLGGGLTARGTTHGLKLHRRSSTGKLFTIPVTPSDRIQADDIILVRESLF